MITTVTTAALLNIGGAIGVAAALVLIAFLATRELAGTSNNSRLARTARLASIGILPLAMSFLALVTVQLAVLL